MANMFSYHSNRLNQELHSVNSPRPSAGPDIGRRTRTYLIDGAIVSAHHESVLVHVQDQVLAHDGQSNQGDVGFPASAHIAKRILLG